MAVDDFLWGKPELKFIVYHGETVKGTFTFDPEVFSEFTPDFIPVTIRHVLQDESIAKKTKGYRFIGELAFGVVQGSVLNELVKLFQSLNAGNNYYDRIEFFPSYIDMPGWSFDVFLSDDEITTGFMALIAHKNIVIKFESKNLLEHIPLAESAFLSWGNMQLFFGDPELDADFSTLP